MVSLLQQINDLDYLNKKLIPKKLRSHATWSLFVNPYNKLKEKYEGFECINVDVPNLVTFVGIDWWHAQLLGNTSQASATIGSNYIALSESLLTPNATWTTLDAEITTGQLGRAQSSPAPVHVVGTNITVLDKTFTANANFSGIRLIGLFNNATAGLGVLNHVGLLDKVTAVLSGQQIRAVSTLTFP
jgi:hypothetical protein